MKPRLALSMIVRDAALLLPACIESAREIVDQIVIADTGSRDDSIAAATRGGAEVLSIPWRNDFAEARNRALEAVRADWVLVLDADEQLDAAAVKCIPALLRNDAAAGYQVTIRNYMLSLQDRLWDRPAQPNDGSFGGAAKYPAYVEHQNVRLFRRNPQISFVGRVHESVGPRIEQLQLHIGRADFVIHHFGLAAGQETQARKNRLYRELGQAKIREMPENAQAYLELGLVELDNFANLAEAHGLFARACELNRNFAVAWFFQGVALARLNQLAAAIPCFERAERLGCRTALVSESLGDALYNLKRFSEAASAYTTAVRRNAPDPALESKAGLALVRSGDVQTGVQLLQRAVQRNPARAELHDRLITCMVWLDRLPEARQAAQKKLTQAQPLVATDYLRAASLAVKLGDTAEAAALLRDGLRAEPENKNLLIALQELAATAAV